MIIYIIKKLFKGQSLARILMNNSLKQYSIQGKVLDIGGGRSPDYFEYFNVSKEATIIPSDLKQPDSDTNRIDFETDPLPHAENSIDQVLMFNILEHIYNHQFLVNQTYKVMKPEASLIGFVPFLVNYHPDPHDYFRYTKEALYKILSSAGFKNIVIKEIGRGPFAVNYNNIVLSFPIVIRVALFPCYYMLDSIFLKLRPQVKIRYPLGFLFECTK